MRNIILANIAAVILVSAAPSIAAAADEKKPDSERKICKSEPDSVSRIARKICKTKSDWEQGGKASPDRADLNRNR